MANTPFDIELDELTLARARRGNMAACESIFRKFHQPAYSVAYRVCRCRETAQEVTQEAFITVFRKMGQYRGDSPFWGWLRRVVVNHAISALRKAPKADPVELQDYHGSSESATERVDLAMDLESALAALDADDRAIVWLHDVEGYNHCEIAQLFGKTESFSKTRLSRARSRLRDLLDRGVAIDPSRNAVAR
jgi:RNA polymerase sigma-70 factor (ECF subfamily)